MRRDDATIDYTVAEDGSITDVTASPDGAEISSDNRSVKVRSPPASVFASRFVTMTASSRSGPSDRIRCDAADPSVNTPIDPDADTGDDDHDGDHLAGVSGDGSHDGGWRDDGEGRGNHRHDRGED